MKSQKQWCGTGRHFVPPSSMGAHASRCKSCHAASQRMYRSQDPEYQRSRWLLRRYGITLDEYNEMWDIQGGVCGICGRPETKMLNGRVIMLAVDHDGKSGVVRGLLCTRCNPGIGYLQHDVTILQAAIDYLLAFE